MSRNKLRVGVIGVGYVASNNFLPVFPRFDDVELSGIMANHLESAKKAQRLCGAQQVVQSLEELVKLDLDCAFVLTPKACHAEQISFLLKAGIDVYSEKPMATTLKDADHMAELSEQTGRKLMIGFNRRYAPVCQSQRSLYRYPSGCYYRTEKPSGYGISRNIGKCNPYCGLDAFLWR